MSKLICNTADEISSVPPDAFELSEFLESCAQIPDLDLRNWAEPNRSLIDPNRNGADSSRNGADPSRNGADSNRNVADPNENGADPNKNQAAIDRNNLIKNFIFRLF